MAGKWDSNLKRLVQANPQEFVDWLLEGAVITHELSVEINREIYIDLVYEVKVAEAREIIHIEFQRYEDEDMAWRVLEYNAFTTCKYKCPVHSFVIYLRKEGRIAESPLVVPGGDRPDIWRFTFHNIKLWEISTDMFREMGRTGVLPLLALTREGGSREIVNEAIARIEQAQLSREEKENLLTFTLYLATLGFKQQGDKDWLKERFMMLKDIIRDTEIYQLILDEGREDGFKKGQEEGLTRGREEGLTEGLTKGREEGLTEGLTRGREEGLMEGREALHRVILSVVQRRFPELTEMANESIRTITDLVSLQKLALDVASTDSMERARSLFVALKKYESH